MPRIQKTAVEIVSDIGSRAFDLQAHSERDIEAAVALCLSVNPNLYEWLVEKLSVKVAAERSREDGSR